MSALSLSIDECVTWAKAHVPLHKQSRYLTDVYKLNRVVNDAKAVLKAMDPANFMFVDRDNYYAHVSMIQDIAATKKITIPVEIVDY